MPSASAASVSAATMAAAAMASAVAAASVVAAAVMSAAVVAGGSAIAKHTGSVGTESHARVVLAAPFPGFLSKRQDIHVAGLGKCQRVGG
jgi:hypothetical protein